MRWRDALHQPDITLWVTVLAVSGSAPREPGARMAVQPEACFDTIGGGHLEFQAIARARALLQQGVIRHIERFALGASLGQCCGGVVWLLFERWDAAQCAHMLQALRGEHTVFRLQALHADAAESAWGEVASLRPQLPAALHAALDQTDAHRCQWLQLGEQQWLLERFPACDFRIELFGAGHVARALLPLLASLPCTVHWMDSREEMLPQCVPDNVDTEWLDDPVQRVAEAVPGSFYLVMTHSHAEDQRLVEHILRRGDAAYCGLIGSRSKRQQFRQRLLRRGVSEVQWQMLTCPIGVAGIHSKQPAAIAIAVAAELLQRYEARQVQQQKRVQVQA